MCGSFYKSESYSNGRCGYYIMTRAVRYQRFRAIHSASEDGIGRNVYEESGVYFLHCNCSNQYFEILFFRTTGLVPDILKIESWMHMGCTANIIIKNIIHIFASISNNMHILLMGRHYHEHWRSHRRGCIHKLIIAFNIWPLPVPSQYTSFLSSAKYFNKSIRKKLKYIH